MNQKYKNGVAKQIAYSTHPDIASLVDPLSACGGKRVKKIYNSPSLRSREGAGG